MRGEHRVLWVQKWKDVDGIDGEQRTLAKSFASCPPVLMMAVCLVPSYALVGCIICGCWLPSLLPGLLSCLQVGYPTLRFVELAAVSNRGVDRSRGRTENAHRMIESRWRYRRVTVEKSPGS